MSESKKPVITVVDYDLGNLFNLRNALEHLGAEVKIVRTAAEVQKAERLILPGVAAFEFGMANLKKQGLVEPILEYAKSDKPLLGICLGMQLLMSESFENGHWKGLGLIEGKVVGMQSGREAGHKVKVPHIGWNRMIESKLPWKKTLLDGLKNGAMVYFVHSYMVDAKSTDHSLAETEFGSNRFASVVRKNNVTGAQFHPERSGEVGLALLKNFVTGVDQ